MKNVYILFFTLTILLFSFKGFENENDNPCMYHHVNVITGQLSLQMEDGIIQGGVQVPIRRTYSSYGALEKTDDSSDLYLKRLKHGFHIQGGWNFFPQTHLLIRPGRRPENYLAYVADASGSITKFEYSHKDTSDKTIVLTSKEKNITSYSKISGKNNWNKTLLCLNEKTGNAELKLPDGSLLFYQGRNFKARKDEGSALTTFYTLTTEIKPNGHLVSYIYDSKDRIQEIKHLNPQAKKCFAHIKFHLDNPVSPYKFHITTSDDKTIAYNFKVESYRDYLESVIHKSGQKQTYDYGKERKGIGARVNKIRFDGKLQSKISYYTPENKQIEEIWRKHPENIAIFGDKVRKLEGPLGSNGEIITYAEFKYSEGITEAKDSEGLITKYYHSDGKLDLIEEYDIQGQLTTKTKFIWAQDNLISKIKLDGDGSALFSKTFSYDVNGNITKEVFYGNLSGKCKDSFRANDDGSLQEAESFVKTFTYSEKMNLLLTENEENGLSYKYFYKDGTNILTKKLTLDKDKILIREFFSYNDDNLLILKINDDGKSENINDLTGITERKITKFTLDDANGIIRSISEFFLNTKDQQEVLIRKSDLMYSPANQVIEERIYDSKNIYKYSIYKQYDTVGHLISHTTPTGEKNTFTYDNFGNVTSIKEVGKPLRHLYYDTAGRLKKEEEITDDGNKKTKIFTHDTKGRILSASDFLGNITYQYYDSFGRCTSTILPEVVDEQGIAYTPKINFSYDSLGNLISTCDPAGNSTYTYYTSTRKPYKIIHADGGITTHEYDKNDHIIKTTHPDGSYEEFKNDIIGRVIKKTFYTSTEEPLCDESYTYTIFHKTSYTDKKGLTTYYIYDNEGKLIEEKSLDRSTIYEYDSLGMLIKRTQNDISYVEIKDVSGRVVEKWEEDAFGKIENKTKFIYNEDGKKSLAIRTTSKGKAKDYFEYDGNGRITLHTDALGNKTKFQYHEKYKSDQNEYCYKKTSIDARGIKTEEYFDVQKRLISTQKFCNNRLCSKEDIFYDRSGKKAKQVSYVLQNQKNSSPYVINWKYDSCGRMIQQIESNTKTTMYTYDNMGRIIQKTLPSCIHIFYEYDCLGRIISLKSSDNTIDYAYYYGLSKNPEVIEDIVNRSYIQREYNLFDQLIKERNELDECITWEYDNLGRRTSMVLPDGSEISYHYQGLHMKRVERISSKGKLYQHSYDDFDENGHVYRETLLNNSIMITDHDLLERPFLQISKWNEQLVEYGPTGLITKIKNSLTKEKIYDYDGLNQINKENDKKHSFDSLGNPTNALIGSCNEIYEVDGIQLSYDENGYITKKITPNESISYNYDSLGRLILIDKQGEDPTYLRYDALGRLSEKKSEKTYKKYLYDHDFEIGSSDQNGDICELKLLGLGIQGDIGSAIAIELSNQIFIPLHDTQGNIIALISSSGSVAEIIDMDAFGQTEVGYRLSPWGFCSKRSENNLVFFGQRFYDPAIKRWTTPDPSGFSDGSNLYAYVRNNPKNRLDLFGLSSEQINYMHNMSLEIPIDFIASNAALHDIPVFTTAGSINGVSVNWLVKLGSNIKLNFSNEELKNGKFNLFDHYHEHLSGKGKTVGLISFQNGILTKLEEVKDIINSLSEIAPNTMILSLYNPTQSGFKDVFNACTEIRGHNNETEMTALTRQYFAAISSTLFNINPEACWLHIAHSRGGGIAARALEGMTNEQIQLMKQNFHYLGLGASVPVSNNYACSAVNCYSEHDNLTKTFGLKYLSHPDYNIEIVPSLIIFKQFAMKLDHSITGETYQNQAKNMINKFHQQVENLQENIR